MFSKYKLGTVASTCLLASCAHQRPTSQTLTGVVSERALRIGVTPRNQIVPLSMFPGFWRTCLMHGKRVWIRRAMRASSLRML